MNWMLGRCYSNIDTIKSEYHYNYCIEQYCCLSVNSDEKTKDKIKLNIASLIKNKARLHNDINTLKQAIQIYEELYQKNSIPKEEIVNKMDNIYACLYDMYFENDTYNEFEKYKNLGQTLRKIHNKELKQFLLSKTTNMLQAISVNK
jgi:hypothetical protein